MKKYQKFTLYPMALLFFACQCGCKENRRRNDKADASGVFEATEVVVSAQASGVILSFSLWEGDMLEANKPMGYIDTIQLHLKKLQLHANIRAVESRKSNIPKQVAAIQEQITIQKKELQRFNNLVSANAATQKQVDDINSAINVLEKQLAAQTELLQNSNRTLEQEHLALEIQVAQLEDQIIKSVISSPISGIVLAKYAECGEVTALGKALFKVADMEHIFLRAYIVSEHLTQMQLGQRVKVTADFGEKERRAYQGTVSWISNQAEFSPKNIQTRNERDNLVYAVKIAVRNDGYLKVGMYGEVWL